MSTASAPVEGAAPVAGSTPAPVASVLPATPTPRTPAPAAASSTPPGGAAPAQGQPGAPAAPETPPAPYEHDWLETTEGGKYRTLDEYRKASDEKGTALRKALNQIRTMEAKSPLLKGPPIDAETGLPGAYEFKPSEKNEKLGRQVDPEDPLLQAATSWGHKWSIPQEAMQELFSGAYEPMLDADMDTHMETENGRLLQFFGSVEAVTAGMDNIAYKLMDLLGGEEAYPEIRRAVGNSDTAIMLHKLIAAMDNVKLPSGGAAATTQESEAEILKMRAEDPNLVKPGNRERYERWTQEEAARRGSRPQGKQTTLVADALRPR